MSNLDNNFNINNTGRAYTPNIKKGDDAESKLPKKAENIPSETVTDGTQAADTYGRILVKQTGKIENPEMVQCVKNAVDFYINNTDLVRAGMKACDDSFELMEADNVPYAYEKACCGICDAIDSGADK